MRLLQEARWIALAALGAFLLLILLTYDKADPGWSHAIVSRTIANAGGRVGAWFADLLLYLFGLSAYLLVAVLGVSVARGLRTLRASAPEPTASQRFAWERWLGFGLLLLGCVGIESARLHSLQADLPLGPGGIVGAVITDPLFVALGPVGGTLVLLVLVAAGFSLWSGWSWLTIFERIGFALEWTAQRLVQAVVARRDRRIGEVAATERDEQVQVKRRILDDDPEPIRIETPVARIERSERAEAERQSVLFVDLPADTQLPPVSLLDDPPVAAEGVSPETLEYTSRLIEKKLSDF
ncbi:MAG TPA: DNA translocase FtsK 4TM domain-containing protein, partial [Burkholderiaceae bacterium]|nr:DNA translocase FtsK 4TM domain-containing protein [Burkholderiaceae bacterium]